MYSRMGRPKGETGDGLIPIMFYEGYDFFYGPKVEKRLIRIESRNKCAWLWCELWRAMKALADFDEALRYAIALQLVERHAERIDRIKGENEWLAILRGKRWSEGITLPGEVKAARKMMEQTAAAMPTRVLFDDSLVWEGMFPSLVKKYGKKEEATMPEPSDYDFVLTGHDMAQGLTWPKPPDWPMMADCAVEIDRRNADAFVMHAQADGFEPREAE